MNSKQFLTWGGVILLVVGIVGFFGIIGPTPDKSIFNDAWYFDNGENWTHTILGIVALIAAYSLQPSSQRVLVMILGIIGILVGLYGIFNQSFLGANLQNPADTLLHLVIGAWALWASMTKSESAPMTS